MILGARTAIGLLAGVSLTVLAGAPTASAAATSASAATQNYDLEPQDLGEALRKIALASGRRFVAASKLLDGKRSGAVKGQLSAEQAYAAALSGTDLQPTAVGEMMVIIQRPADLPSGQPPEAHPQVLSEVTVTGTRIRGQTPVGANLIVLDRNAIDQSGYASTAQLLQALPQNFGGGASESTEGVSFRNNAGLNLSYGSGVNLRGLGNTSTLVLLNGQRPALDGTGGVFADVSMVPSSIVQRVEVLADGASALYGSDAVAGVVNFIFRDNFEGAETSLRYGTGDGDFGETQISQIVGGSWGSGHAVFAYEYYDRTNLPANDRAYATENLVPFGGQDYRSPFSAPGNILAGVGTYAIPAGSTGVGLTASSLLAGQTNLTDQIRGTDLLPDQRRHSFYGSVHQDLDADTTVFAQGLFAERTFLARVIPNGEAPYTVPTTNPFYVDPLGTGQPVQVEYNLNHDLGSQLQSGMTQGYDATVGIDHRFGAWTAELLGDYGLEREYSASYNVPNTTQVAAALADTNPATALNLFGSGGGNTPATLNQIRGYDSDTSHSAIWSVGAKLDGPLFDLPAGVVRAAFGAEYRVERYKVYEQQYLDTATPVTLPVPDIPGPRSVAAAYGELLIPVVDAGMGVPGVRRLDLSVAGRFEHYSDVGSTANPKVGLGLSVVSGVDLRLAYGTSFRAPSFNDLRYGPGEVIYAAEPLTDPKSPTGLTNTLLLVGNSPTLKPETATTWNAGLDLKPDGLPGFKASVSYFLVDFDNRIATPTNDILSVLENRSTYAAVINTQPSAATIAAYYASPYFENPYNIPASAITTIVDNRVQNIARVHQDGLDFDAGYTHPIGPVTAGAGLGGTYILHVDQSVSAGAPTTNVVATIGEPVRLRLRGRVTAASGPYSGALFVNYTGAYSNPTFTPAERVSSWTTVDAQLGYSLPAKSGVLHGVKLALNVSNLTNAAPPYVANFNGISAVGYDSDNASPLGRVISLQLTKAW